MGCKSPKFWVTIIIIALFRVLRYYNYWRYYSFERQLHGRPNANANIAQGRLLRRLHDLVGGTSRTRPFYAETRSFIHRVQTSKSEKNTELVVQSSCLRAAWPRYAVRVAELPRVHFIAARHCHLSTSLSSCSPSLFQQRGSRIGTILPILHFQLFHHHHNNYIFEKDYSVANNRLIKELSFERRGRQRRENQGWTKKKTEKIREKNQYKN